MKPLQSMKRQKGISIIEVMIGLAILVVFIAAFLTIGRSLLGQGDVSTAAMEHQSLVNGVRSMYRLDNNYVGVAADVVLTSGQAVPDSMRSADNTTIRHEWSIDEDDVDIDEWNGGQGFTVTYNEIPPEFCVGFASAVFRDANVTEVNDTAITGTTEATENCDQDGNNTIAFSYN